MVNLLASFLAGVSLATELPRTVPLPPPATVMEIREAALKGDAIAQYNFGLSYQSHLDAENALMWFRKAARQGMGAAQFELAKTLWSGLNVSPQNRENGLRWLLLAANQNVVDAQLFLGNWYADKKFTRVEAFKWYTLAAQSNRAYQRQVDGMILKMSAAELQSGKQWVKGFKPCLPAKIAPGFKLQGLMGSGEKQLALINGKAFMEKESGAVKVDDEMVKIYCVELTADSALIAVEGGPTLITLNLETK